MLINFDDVLLEFFSYQDDSVIEMLELSEGDVVSQCHVSNESAPWRLRNVCEILCAVLPEEREQREREREREREEGSKEGKRELYLMQHYFHCAMIWCHSVSDKTKGNREFVQDIHFSLGVELAV